MRISDIVAQYIIKMLEESDGNAQIQRNELASELGCVPSQISYVITSRFTPEQGYIVESRRGGGGCIRITRVDLDKESAVMNIINSVGQRLDFATTVTMLQNLVLRDIISTNTSKLMSAALSDRSYMSVPVEYRDYLRSSIFKNMLLAQI